MALPDFLGLGTCSADEASGYVEVKVSDVEQRNCRSLSDQGFYSMLAKGTVVMIVRDPDDNRAGWVISTAQADAADAVAGQEGLLGGTIRLRIVEGSPDKLQVYDTTAAAMIMEIDRTNGAVVVGWKAGAQAPLLASQKAAASGVASLSAGSLVVQNPENATATPTASKIAISDAAGLLDAWTRLGKVTTVPGAYPYVVLNTDGMIALDGGAGPGNVVATLPELGAWTSNSPIIFLLSASTGGGADLTPDAAEAIGALGVGVAYPLLQVGQVVCLKPNAAHTGWDIVFALPVTEVLVPPTVPGAYPYAVLAGDRTILGDDHVGAGDNIVTLPPATGSGRPLTFILRTIDGVGTFQVDPDGVELIDALGAGVAYTALDAVGDTVTIKDAEAGQWRSIAAIIAP